MKTTTPEVGETLKSFNPATGEVVAEVKAKSPGEVADVVAHARKVAPDWAAIPAEGRARMLRQVRHRIYDNMDDIIETVASECGKPRAEALAHDVLPAVLTLQYYERVAPKALRPEKAGRVIGPVLGLASAVEWRPYGVVGSIAPWNYPFFLSFMGMAPALFAGNAVVLKPTEATPEVGERVREVLEPLPSGVATVIQGGGDVGAALVDAPCDKLSFIGSAATGRKIAEAAAKHLTPVVMELGGQDAAVVCGDADVEVASSGVLWGSFVNAGQTCCAIERAYVVDSIADEFSDKVVSKLSQVRHGHDGEIGALTVPRQLETVRRHVADAVAKGAKVLAGGPEARSGNGAGGLFFAPTVLEGRSEDMAYFKEETFGPVLPIVRVRDEEEAIRRANEDGVNLTASVWTSDRKKGEDIARRLKAGTVNINDHAATAGAPWGPWGGVGESGHGRLNGIHALREFTVPVHVARNMTPHMKRAWWYPYDDATVRLLRSLAELLSSRDAGVKARALGSLARNLPKALRKKV